MHNGCGKCAKKSRFKLNYWRYNAQVNIEMILANTIGIVLLSRDENEIEEVVKMSNTIRGKDLGVNEEKIKLMVIREKRRRKKK